jgi:hypothetical protein
MMNDVASSGMALGSRLRCSQFVLCYSLTPKGVLSIVVVNSLFDGYQKCNTFVGEFTEVLVGIKGLQGGSVTSETRTV